MGYDAEFICRIDYRDMHERKLGNGLQGIWRPETNIDSSLLNPETDVEKEVMFWIMDSMYGSYPME